MRFALQKTVHVDNRNSTDTDAIFIENSSEGNHIREGEAA